MFKAKSKFRGTGVVVREDLTIFRYNALRAAEKKYGNKSVWTLDGKIRWKVDNFIKFNKVGQEVDVDFNVQTNEYKDKYYTSLQAWKIFKAEAKASEVVEDDLPF